MKLLYILPSIKSGKKFMAIFTDKDDIKTVHFGSVGYDDYTSITTPDREKRKKMYINRHKKNEDWNDPYTAGSLSRWILWNKKTIEESIQDYRKRFNL